MSALSPLSGSEIPTRMGWLLLALFEVLEPRPQADTRTSAPAARPAALPDRHALIANLPLLVSSPSVARRTPDEDANSGDAYTRTNDCPSDSTAARRACQPGAGGAWRRTEANSLVDDV